MTLNISTSESEDICNYYADDVATLENLLNADLSSWLDPGPQKTQFSQITLVDRIALLKRRLF